MISEQNCGSIDNHNEFTHIFCQMFYVDVAILYLEENIHL